MEFRFTCECGDEIQEFTRGSDDELSVRVPCETCGAVYAVSITQLRAPDQND